MRLVLYNACGLSGKAEMVHRVWEGQRADILCLTETWCRPTDRLLLQMPADSVAVGLAQGQWRGHGGVAFGARAGVRWRTLFKEAEANYQMLATLVGGRLRVITLYISPRARVQEVRRCLRRVRELARGPTIVAGDLNARHSQWDTTPNNRGRLLMSWALKWGWEIKAPADPTFCRNQGSSTVDIVLAKGVNTNQPITLFGPWDGTSDHQPVLTVLEGGTGEPAREAPTRIPRAMFQKEALQRTVREEYSRELPTLLERIRACSDGEELDRVYEAVARAMVEPWRKRCRKRSRRFRYFWDGELDGLARKRSQFYRKFQRWGLQEDWNLYKKVDKEIKRRVRRKKKELFESYVEELAEAPRGESTKRVNTLVKLKTRFSARSLERGAMLDPSCFTRHLALNSRSDRLVAMRNFHVSDEFKEDVGWAVRNAPRGKAPGPDGVLGDMWQVAAAEVTEVITELWRKCGEIGYTPKLWRRATVVPVFKKGEQDDPGNYRPISLLSHVRKVVEKAIDRGIRRVYRFHHLQLGFRPCVGTDVAVVRTVASMQEESPWAAVLDLKAAYDTVPKHRVQQRCDAKLPGALAGMVSHVIAPIQVSTVGDPGEETYWLQKGVPQGGAVSPTLFNIFIDTLAEGLGNSVVKDERPGGLWADDVIVLGADEATLQRRLDICSGWAEENEMTWNTKIGKSQVLEGPREASFYLAGTKLSNTQEARYLGVSVKQGSVTEEHLVARIRAAQGRLQQLAIIGFNRSGYPPELSIRVFKGLVRPMFEYALPLTPIGPAALIAYNSLEAQLLRQTFGDYASASGRRQRMRILCRLPSLEERKGVLTRKLVARIQGGAEGARAAQLTDLEKIDVTKEFRCAEGELRRLLGLEDGEADRRANRKAGLSQADITKRWVAYNRTKVRKIPVTRKWGVPPVMGISKKRRTRAMAIRWYVHCFPESPTKVCERMGVAGRKCMETLARVLPRQVVSKKAMAEAAKAIEAILSQTE